MDEKVAKVFQSLDDGTRLLKGEWTSDGRRLFRFVITEILAKNVGGIAENGEGLISQKAYCLSGILGKERTPIHIWIYKAKDDQSLKSYISNGHGIGSFMPLTGDSVISDTEEGYVELFLDTIAFDNLVQTIRALRFKGEIKFQVVVKKEPDNESASNLKVIEYTLENCLTLQSD